MAETVEIDIVANDKTSGIIQGIFQGIGQQIANFAMQIPGAIMDFGASILNEAMDAQLGMAQLEAVIKSTGGAAGMTTDELTKMADELSQVTRFSDDAIISGENMLLTFTNIGEDVFPAATKAILDVSTAMNQDLKSSAVQLGKALNDPIEGIGALTRIGITFTDEQKNLIESLVKTGDIVGAQKIILEELNKEFGGSAEAAGQTFAGQLDILKNSLNNVKEGIGMALLPVLNELGEKYLPIIMPMIEDFGAKLAEWVPMLGPVIDRLLNVATAVWEFLQPAFEAIGEWWEANGTDIIFKATTFFDSLWVGANKAAEWIKSTIMLALSDLGAWWDENGATIVQTAKDIWGSMSQGVEDAAESVGIFLSENLPKVRQWFDDNGPFFKETGGQLWDSLTDSFDRISTRISKFINEELPSLTGGVKKNSEDITSAQWAWIAFTEYIEFSVDLISGGLDILALAFERGLDFISHLANGGMDIMHNFANGLADLINGNIKEAIEDFSGMFVRAADTIKATMTDLNSFMMGAIMSLSNSIASALNLGQVPSGASEGIAGARAGGGPVAAGQSYLVGERGAEIFRPSQGGTIIPNGGVGGGSVNVTLHYSPSVALGNQYEAENTLLPFILQGIRAAQANGLVPVGS